MRTPLRRTPGQMAIVPWEGGSAICFRPPKPGSVIPLAMTTGHPYALSLQWRLRHHACFSASLPAIVQIVDQHSPIVATKQTRALALRQYHNLRLNPQLLKSVALTECLTGLYNSLQTRIVTPTGVRMIYGCLEYDISAGNLSKSRLFPFHLGRLGEGQAWTL